MLRSTLAKRRSARPRRWLHLCASVLGHALLLAGWFGFGAGGEGLLQSAGGGSVPTMEVSLVAGETRSDSPQPPVLDPAAELLARLGEGERQSPAARVEDVDPATPSRVALSELLGEASSSAASAGDPKGQEAGTSERARKGRKDATGSMSGGAAASRGSAGGGLWALIEPCWRRQQVPAGAHAQILVELDFWGRLAAPPQIVRTRDMRLDRDQLLSEARAVDALTACLPLAKGRFSGAHRLDFRRPD